MSDPGYVIHEPDGDWLDEHAEAAEYWTLARRDHEDRMEEHGSTRWALSTNQED